MRRVIGGYLIRDCDKFHLTGVNTFTPGYELYRENVKMHLFDHIHIIVLFGHGVHSFSLSKHERSQT